MDGRTEPGGNDVATFGVADTDFLTAIPAAVFLKVFDRMAEGKKGDGNLPPAVHTREALQSTISWA